MRKELARIAVDEGVGLCVQKLDYECDGLKALNCQLIRAGEGDSESRSEWLERYKIAFAERQVAMDELIHILMADLVDGRTQFHLDYRTFELVACREED